MQNRYFFLIAFVFFCLDFDLLSGVSEGKFEAPKIEEPGRYQEPKNEQEARQAWDKSQKELEKARKAEEEIRAKLPEMNKKLNDKQITPKEHNQFLDSLGQITKSRDAWQERQQQLSQNELVKKYTEQLAKQFELPVSKPTFQEPSWWQNTATGVRSWFKEQKAKFYEWIGNKERVVQIRNELAILYADLGPRGLLDKARNSKRLTGAIDILQKKIAKGLDAVAAYKEALNSGVIEKKQAETFYDEIKELVVDLITMREQLGQEEIDQQTRDTIDKEIDILLENFGISKNVRDALEQQAGAGDKKIPSPSRLSEIDLLAQKVAANIDRNSKWAKALKADPINFLGNQDFKEFAQNLAMLDHVDFTRLSQISRSLYRQYVSEGYKNLYDAMIQEALNVKIPAVDRSVLLSRAMKIYSSYIESLKKFNFEFEQVSKEIARNATPEEMKNESGQITSPVPVGYAEQFSTFFKQRNYVDRVLSKLIENDSESFEKEYFDTFDPAMAVYRERVEKAAVDQESLKVRQKILETYETLFKEIDELSTDPKIVLGGEFGKVMLDVLIKIKALREGLEKDRAILVILQEEGPKLKADLLKSRARLNEETLIQEQEKVTKKANQEIQDFIQQSWERSTEQDKRQLFLLEIKMKKLRPTDLGEKATSGEQFLTELGKRLKEEENTLSPELKEKIRQAKTETELKNAVAEIEYESIKNSLRKTETREPLTPKDWWNDYLKEGAERGTGIVSGPPE